MMSAPLRVLGSESRAVRAKVGDSSGDARRSGVKRQGKNSEIYAASARFVDAALREDGSLFTPGLAIWARANLDDLYARFVARPDESTDAFLVKFQRQLADAPDS